MSTALDTRRSVYPVPVTELTGRVRAQAAQLGALPSLRQVMTVQRVGRPKAAAALDALRADGFTSAAPDSAVAPAVEVDAVEVDEVHVDEVEMNAVEVDTASPDTAPDVSHAVAADPWPADLSTAVQDRSGLVTAGAEARLDAGRWQHWPLILISLGAFVSIWGGWVGLGELTGFGPIRLLPGIADRVVINSAITLPIGVEAYAAFALRTWLAPTLAVSARARRFARWSTVGALALGAAGQIAYHLMIAAGVEAAPWPITAFVSCLPVLVLGCGAALTHLTRHPHPTDRPTSEEDR